LTIIIAHEIAGVDIAGLDNDGPELEFRKFLTPFKLSGVKWLHFTVFRPYWSNLHFIFFDIWALWCSVLGARVPEYQKIVKVG